MSFYSVAPFIEKYYPEYYSIETYPVTECVSFCEVKGEWGVFSNFAHTPIQYDGVTYKNVEQLFQMMKFTNKEVREKVYAAPNPKMTAKHYEKTHRRDDWGMIIVDAMKQCLQLKYVQSEKFREALERSNGKYIVEDQSSFKKSWADTWGVKRQGDFYVGPNLMGRLLMELRDNCKLEYQKNNNIMQIKKHITPINLNLRYDCIYYFPSRTDNSLNTKMMEAVEGWRCSFYPEMILVKNYPKIKFQYIPDEDLVRLYDTASGNDENSEYARRLLEEVCGNEDGGVLVSRLYSKDSGDDVELFVSYDLLSGCDYVNGILNEFALEIAKENFERITGKSYSSYKAYEDNNRGGSSTDFITIDSRKYQQESRYESRIEQQLREKTSKFSSLSEYNSMEDILEDLKKLCTEIEDGKKLLKRHKIVVEYSTDTMDYEIYVILNKDKRIRCVFERGIIGKVFYIFFLRHPKGGTLTDLSSCVDELLKIYERFDLTGDEEKMDRRKPIENMLFKGPMNQYRSNVRTTFKEIFGSAIVSDYCININESKMSIPLDRKYVDLGELEK